jgi:cephalosporin hydroxylase
MFYFEGRSQLMKALAFQKRVVEVGVNIGQFSSLILEACPLELYLVDCWEQQNLNNYENDILYNSNHTEAYKYVCSKFYHMKNIKIIKDYSLKAVQNFPDKYFDIVYLDANHSKESVYQDLIAWTPKIKSGGFMSGHDYLLPDMTVDNTHIVNGVREAVQKFLLETNRKLYALSIRTTQVPDCSFVFQI